MGAEHLTRSVGAASAMYTDTVARLALGGVRLRRRPELVRAEIPSGDYVDAVTPVGEIAPTAFQAEWGQAIADQGHPGIALPLLVAPPPGAEDLSAYVFVPLRHVGLRVLQTQPLP